MLDSIKKMFGIKPTVIYEAGKYPHVKGYANINYSKCVHKRRILKHLLCGMHMSSMEYADDFHTTKFSTRVSELRNEFGFNIQDYWEKSDNGKKFKRYYIEKDNVA